MSFARILCGLGAATLLSFPAVAQVVDDFEHGNEALYAQATSGDNMDLNAVAARASAFGAQFASGASGFRLRSDVVTGPGNTYEWYVRLRGGSTNSGRSYTGFGATAAGAYSGVFAPNTGNIILQSNISWGFTDVAVAPFVPAADTWYLMRLVWAANGDMTLSILDEAGAATLATTATVSTGFTTSGGLSLRGFTTAATFFNDVDTVRKVGGGPTPFNYCTAKVTSSGCVPAIAFTGTPSAAGNYTVNCSQVEAGQLGVLFYGTSGPAAIAFQGGFLCVNPPVIRMPVQPSGGAAACSGTYTQAMTALITTLPVGQMVNCQYWFRDPGAATGTGLSNANEFVTQ